MVWEGKDVVKQGRAMIGATNPLASAPGTIRGDYCIEARPRLSPHALCFVTRMR
jgi:nucleoside diphosphate kinase